MTRKTCKFQLSVWHSCYVTTRSSVVFRPWLSALTYVMWFYASGHLTCHFLNDIMFHRGSLLSLASLVSSPWDVLAFSSAQQTSKRCSGQLEASVAYFGRFTYHFPGFQQYLVCMCMYYSILLDITTMLDSPGPDWEELASLPDQQKNHSASREAGSWEHKRILWEPMVSMEDPT